MPFNVPSGVITPQRNIMSVRARPRRSHGDGEPLITIRGLLLGALAISAGVLAWRYPGLTGPAATSLATFVVLDRLTS